MNGPTMRRLGDGRTRATVTVPTSRGLASITSSIARTSDGSAQRGSLAGSVLMARAYTRSASRSRRSLVRGDEVDADRAAGAGDRGDVVEPAVAPADAAR